MNKVKKNQLIIFLLTIVTRVWPIDPYPLNFPDISCEQAWTKNFNNAAYDFSIDTQRNDIGNIGYKAYYQRIKRKNCYKEWTVLIFMAADNDLTPYALWDLYEMERQIPNHKNLGSTTNKIDVIAELDTYYKTGIRRFHLFQTDKPYETHVNYDFFKTQNEQLIDSPIIKFDQETGLGTIKQSQRLAEFLKQSIRDYPSKHYLLVLWGHGEGYISIQGDRQKNTGHRREHYIQIKQNIPKLTLPSDSKGILSISDIEINSLRNIYDDIIPTRFPLDKPFGGYGFDFSEMTYFDIPSIKNIINTTLHELGYEKPLDIVAFDACLMQTVEVVSELMDSTDFLVGSTQIQDYLGLPYRMILDEMNAQSIAPYKLSQIIPTFTKKSYEVNNYQYEKNRDTLRTLTASSISTSIFKHHFLPQFAHFIRSLTHYLHQNPDRIIDLLFILNYSPAFLGETRDFGIFLGQIEQILQKEVEQHISSTSSLDLKKAIIKLWSTLNMAMFANEYGTLYSDTSLPDQQSYLLGFFRGISIWLPSDKELYDARIKEFQTSKFYQKSDLLNTLNTIYSSQLLILPPYFSY